MLGHEHERTNRIRSPQDARWGNGTGVLTLITDVIISVLTFPIMPIFQQGGNNYALRKSTYR